MPLGVMSHGRDETIHSSFMSVTLLRWLQGDGRLEAEGHPLIRAMGRSALKKQATENMVNCQKLARHADSTAIALCCSCTGEMRCISGKPK